MRLLIALLALALAAPAAAFTVRDMRGHELTLPAPPRRIVCLVPSAAEIVYALGSEDRLVGVTSFCTWPPAARRKPRVGDMVAPSVERIVALRPDVVIATSEGNSQVTFDQLARLRIPVFAVAAHHLEDLMTLIGRLGELAGRPEAAPRLVETLRARAQGVVTAVRPYPRPRVLYVLWPDPIIVPGRDGLVSDLIDLAGGASVSAALAGSYPRLSLEAVVAARPEVIVLARHGGGETPALGAMWDRLGAVPAIRAGRVYAIDGDLLHRYGPRVVDGLEMLARVIHPEAGLETAPAPLRATAGGRR